MASGTEAGCQLLPEEAWKDGIADALSMFIPGMFMPGMAGIVCPDWSCPDMDICCSASWATDEIARAATAEKNQTGARMLHSCTENALRQPYEKALKVFRLTITC
jgi:hypothetical protein